MEKILKTLAFLFILGTVPANAQIGDFEASIGNAESSGGGDIDDWLFLIDILWYPTYGAFFGYEGELDVNAHSFSKYPYVWEDVGMYNRAYEEGRWARTELNFHFQSNEDRLYGGYGQIKISPWRFLNFELNHLQLIESLNTPDEGTDQLAITNFNVQFNRIRHHKIQGWWGGGLMFINGEEATVTPSAVLGTTIYIKKPISLYLDAQIGWPEGTVVTQTQARLQIHLNRFKVYGGYQGLRFGRVFEPNWMFGFGAYF